MISSLYDLCGTVLRLFYGVFFPVDLKGAENIPDAGGFVVVANHLSARDPFYLCAFLRKRRLHFMAKKELFSFKPLGAFLQAIGAFPVDRGHSDLGAVRTAMTVIKDGHGLGIFPQGTRSKANERLPMLEGVSLIAMRAAGPIIPVYIGGPYRLFRKTPLIVGRAVDIAQFGRRADAQTLAAVTKAIEDGVWNLKS